MLTLSRCAINVAKNREFVYTLATNSAQPDLHALATASGWNQSSALIVNITAALINTLILNGSKTFPNGLRINASAATLIAGLRNGGTAFQTRVPVTINNLGKIAGGGGMGGEGQSASLCWGGACHSANGGAGGSGAGFASASDLTLLSLSPGQTGQNDTRPSSGYPGDTGSWIVAGNGGAGGDLGMPGSNGDSAATGGSYSSSNFAGPTLGQSAGFYVDGISYVTWLNTGTLLGRSI